MKCSLDAVQFLHDYEIPTFGRWVCYCGGRAHVNMHVWYFYVSNFPYMKHEDIPFLESILEAAYEDCYSDSL